MKVVGLKLSANEFTYASKSSQMQTKRSFGEKGICINIDFPVARKLLEQVIKCILALGRSLQKIA